MFDDSVKAIDLFAGGGGMSTGAVQAGLEIVWAGNHSPVAVECHEKNHPRVIHACEDMHRVNWSEIPKFNVMLGAPSCVGHTRARGKDKPVHNIYRSTAWAIIDCLEYHSPCMVMIENVPEFLKWDRFPMWLDALKSFGYKVTIKLLNAADAGVPQERHRMILVALKGSKRAPWISDPNLPHVAADTIINWNGGRWRSVENRKHPLKPETLYQIKCGRAVHGERFIIPYYGSDRKRGVTCSIHKPLRTVTTVERFGLYREGDMRMMSVDEYRQAQTFPDGYWLPSKKADAVKLIGNAVPVKLIKYVLDQVKCYL